MGETMKLLDVVGRLSDFDEEDTIYVSEPWTEESDAMVAPEPEEGLVPANAAKAGLTYFIEIFIAIEFTEAWIASLDEEPSLSAICQRLIEYATYDA